MELPREIWDRCTFTLFPFVSGGSGRDSVRWAHEEAIEQLRAGAPHPLRNAVLEWSRLAQEHEEAWQGLSEAEQGVVTARWREDAERPPTTPAVDRYDRLEAELDAVYYEQLRPGEIAKIRGALDELRSLLAGP